MSCFVNIHEKPLGTETEEEGLGGKEWRKGGEREGKERREGKLGSGCKINKKIIN